MCPPQPRAVSRSAMVKAVVASETQEEVVLEKPVKNVCLVEKPQIFPLGNSMTTRAVIGELLLQIRFQKHS